MVMMMAPPCISALCNVCLPACLPDWLQMLDSLVHRRVAAAAAGKGADDSTVLQLLAGAASTAAAAAIDWGIEEQQRRQQQEQQQHSDSGMMSDSDSSESSSSSSSSRGEAAADTIAAADDAAVAGAEVNLVVPAAAVEQQSAALRQVQHAGFTGANTSGFSRSALSEVQGSWQQLLDGLLPVSIHLPLHRMVAMCVRAVMDFSLAAQQQQQQLQQQQLCQQLWALDWQQLARHVLLVHAWLVQVSC
jgi:hypothetical protein